MVQDARGWCTGMTQRDSMGRDGGGRGFQDGEHVYTRGRFMLKEKPRRQVFLHTRGMWRTW